MKNFDQSRADRRYGEEERTFQIHGETFVLRQAIHPEALEGYDRIQPETGIAETLRIVDETIIGMIEPYDDAEDRYRQIRDDRDDPVTVDDLLELVGWMVETQSGRPTGRPGVSSPGQKPIAPRSTERSSLQAVSTE